MQYLQRDRHQKHKEGLNNLQDKVFNTYAQWSA